MSEKMVDRRRQLRRAVLQKEVEVDICILKKSTK